MVNNNPGSIYPQFLQMRKNSFRHATSKAMIPGGAKAKSKKQIQSDTPDPDAVDEQTAQAKTLRKMGNNAYKSDLDQLTNAYSSFDSGDSGTFGAGGGKGGQFGGK
jgi:hypothetical protein